MADSIQFRFHCDGFSEDTFEVVRFTGEEGISQLYRFDVDLLSTDADIDIDDLQDQQSTLVIAGIEHERRIQGVAAEVQVLDQAGGMAMYRVSIMPRLWHLSLSQANAVYLERATPDVIKGTLEDQLGLTTADFDMELETDYRDWPFRLQYGETYWDFLSRLMERDGIYYYFVSGEDSEKPVFCDSHQRQPRIDSPALPYTAGLGMTADEQTMADGTIDSLVMHQRRLPQTVWIQNYNDDKPSTPIRRSAEVDPRGTGDINLYGQNVLDPSEATAIANIRAEEIRAGKAVYHGSSTAFRFTPGYRFELTNHPRTRNNREYQLLTVEHSGHSPEATSRIGQMPEGDTPVYENRFTAIPADTQFRAPRTTDWPSIRGTLNAHVDASGEGTYAELDEEGRYHIVFPFHRGTADPGQAEIKKLASHWLRMVQPYSGHREGMHFPLRKGTRVLVSFIGGNPDLPVIAGTLPDAEQPSVVRDDNQTRGRLTTPGGNELETDDVEGRERMRFSSRTARSSFRIGADQHHMLGGGSVGAADTYSPPDPDADGIEAETDGTVRVAYFGGTNYLLATAGWSVKSTLWPATPIARDDELSLDETPKGLAFLRNYSGDQDEWRTKDGPERAFAFPRKHKMVAGADDDSGWDQEHVTAHEEAYGTFLLTRTVGDEYSYRSGTTFSFQGIDREVFDFGPMAAFTFAYHNPSDDVDFDDSPGSDVKKARDTVSKDLGLDDLTTPESSAFTDAEEALSRFREEEGEAKDRVTDWQELASREEELSSFSFSGHLKLANAQEAYPESRNSNQSQNSGSTSSPLMSDDNLEFLHKATLLFDDPTHLDRWLELANYAEDSRSTDAIRELRDTEQSRVGWAVQETALTEADPPRDGSVKKAQDDLDEFTKEYKETRDTLRSNRTTSESNVFHNLDMDDIRNSRITFNKFNQFSWHQGVIYDFGGCWNYNIGNGYEENHIVSESKGADAAFDQESDYDLLKKGGYGWISESGDPWSSKLDSMVKSKLPGNNEIVVSKTFGATYDFQKGVALSSQQGPSLDVKQGGPNVERTYSGHDQLVEHVTKESGITTTRKNHRVSGAPLLYSRETWGDDAAGAGKNSFSTEFAPALSLDIKCAMEHTTEINLAFSVSTNIHAGASIDVDLYAGVKTDISISASAELSIDIFATAKTDMTIGTGGILEIKSYAGLKIEADVQAPALKVTMPGVEAEAKVSSLSLNTAAAFMAARTVEVETSTMKIGGKSFELK